MIHLAASGTGPKTLSYLLSKAKESPQQLCNNKDQATPLHFAILANQLENTNILLRHGANPNSTDSYGNTPMHFAVANQNLRLVKTLEEFGADGTIQNED